MRKDRQSRRLPKDAADHGDRIGGDDCPVIVVGIGVSSGGLMSLRQLFAKMPPGHGVAFVVVQNLELAREKQTTMEILRDQTMLTVVEAADGMSVLADRIHVMPPNKFFNIIGCKLSLHEQVHCNGLRLPIDHFFCSLAEDQRLRGCGIVLSGIGSDGTMGLSEIKAVGGRTIVEDPRSAEFPNMPLSAIEAGVVDAVLPASAMAEAVLSLTEQVRAETRSYPVESPEFDANLRAILDILRMKVGYDFRYYKPNTLVRRIRRRMTLAKISAFADYARFLQDHPEEVGLLQKDLLIGVTEFFRQPQVWEILTEKIIAALVENTPQGSEIRVWVPGCSTGQEAYSLAIVLEEQVEKSGKKVGIQIFATDSDTTAVATARSGSYSEEEIGKNVAPDRLRRFFVRKEGRYQVIKTIREQIVFASQNLMADPPFSRLDLISCRNLLIYLDQQVQQKIIALFHFALREGGFLFLGTAETVGDRENLFEPIAKKWRIYRRIGAGRSVGIEIPLSITGGPIRTAGKLSTVASAPRLSLASTAQQMLLDRFAPACVIIDRKLQVLYVHGPVVDYLTFPTGELTARVIDMAREGLRARLRSAIGKCLEINRSVSVAARVRRGEKSVPVKTTVSRLVHAREADGLLLITFEEYRRPAVKSGRQVKGESDIQHLEDELKITREELQSTIEQLENSNDQLKASNEEVTAANEELQSANEEMEISKEELQSLNEELNTINARLQEKVDELASTNNDVVNLLSSTTIATVFLDKELKVKRYTPAITRLLSLIPSDVGRPIADVLRHFSDEVLLDDARLVLADLTPLAKEVQANDGRWYIRRITPYRTQDDRIEGVVLTFVDVADLKETEQALRRSEERFRAVVDQAAIGIEQLKLDGVIIDVNPMMTQILGYSREELLSKTLEEIRHPEDIPKERELINLLLEGRVPSYNHEMRYIRKDGSPVWARVTSFLTRDASVKPISRISIIEDITEQKRAENLNQALNTINEIIHSTLDFDAIMQRVVSEAAKAIDCETAAISLHAGDFWRVSYIYGFPKEMIGMRMSDDEERHALLAIQTKSPVVINDTCSDERVNREHMKKWDIRSVMVVPLWEQNEVIGVIFFNYQKKVFNFQEIHIDYAKKLSASVSLAITNARLFKKVETELLDRKQAEETLRIRTNELEHLTETLEHRVQSRTAELARANEGLRLLSSRLLSAQEDERKRIAGDLHDTIGASLAGIKFKVEKALEQIRNAPDAATESLNAIIPVVQDSIEECRRIQMDLRPPILDDLGLLPTLSWFCRSFQTIYSAIRIEQAINIPENELPSALKIVIYRVTQEAMNNIAKHSKADYVHLSFRKMNKRMELKIQDNGQGFNVEKALALESARRGLGLSSMRERVELSGGSFALESIEGKGTIIRASWPLA